MVRIISRCSLNQSTVKPEMIITLAFGERCKEITKMCGKWNQAMLQPFWLANVYIHLVSASSQSQETALGNKAARLQDTWKIQELKMEQKSVNGRDDWVYGGPPTEFQEELGKTDGRQPTGAPWANFLGGQDNCRAKVLESICRRKCRHDLGASRLAHYF